MIDNRLRDRIREVIRYAEENVINFDDQLSVIAGVQKPAGDDPNRVVILPVDYRIVFSIDESQSKGRYRHISMSVPTPGKVPNVIAAEEIIKEFGFTDKIAGEDSRYSLMISMEEIGEGHQAISIIEKIKDHG